MNGGDDGPLKGFTTYKTAGTAKGRLSRSKSHKTPHSVGWVVGWKISRSSLKMFPSFCFKSESVSSTYYSVISKMAAGSSRRGCSPASSIERGSLRAAEISSAWTQNSKTKLIVNALATSEGECATATRQPRRVAQEVVSVGPPIRGTIFREVAAMTTTSFPTAA